MKNYAKILPYTIDGEPVAGCTARVKTITGNYGMEKDCNYFKIGKVI